MNSNRQLAHYERATLPLNHTSVVYFVIFIFYCAVGFGVSLNISKVILVTNVLHDQLSKRGVLTFTIIYYLMYGV